MPFLPLSRYSRNNSQQQPKIISSHIFDDPRDHVRLCIQQQLVRAGSSMTNSEVFKNEIKTVPTTKNQLGECTLGHLHFSASKFSCFLTDRLQTGAGKSFKHNFAFNHTHRLAFKLLNPQISGGKSR